MGPLLTFALDSNNQLVHVDSVAQGSACQCYCPHCKSPLDAKNGGQIREHHFAHAHGHYACEGACESALHLLAKQVIQEQGGIMLPNSEDGGRPSGFVELRDVKVETMDERYGMKPDVEGIMPDGRRLLIECLVTHEISEKKYNTIVENGLLCIEIDFNDLELDKEVLKKFITQNTEGRKWIIRREKKKPSDGVGSIRQKDPLHETIQKWLKNAFDDGTLSLELPRSRRTDNFYSPQIIEEDIIYNLRKLGYDTCEVDTIFQRFRSDLLLYRSSPDQERGYISINIREKPRGRGFKYPNGWKIIDVIFDDILFKYFSQYSDIQRGILSYRAIVLRFEGDWKTKTESNNGYVFQSIAL